MSTRTTSLVGFGRARAALAAAAALFAAHSAHGAMILLSTHTSDGSDPTRLRATMDFSVVGSTMTLVVTNNTSSPAEYRVNSIGFNLPTGVTLSFQGLTGWTTQSFQSTVGFGMFDIGLNTGGGSSPNQVQPNGGTRTFVFTILTGAPTADDFVAAASTTAGIELKSSGAAFFRAGPSNHAAWGAFVVPTPGASALGAAGVCVMLATRRRR